MVELYNTYVARLTKLLRFRFFILAANVDALDETANIVNLYSVDPREWSKEPGNIYIGRETRYLAASKWGNPYIMDRKKKQEKRCDQTF